MRTKRLRYLQKKLHQECKLKSILLAFFAAILLSACGIKGDLYETPKQPSLEQNKVKEQGDVSQENGTSEDTELKKKTVKKPVQSEKKQAVPQPIEHAATPPAKQPTAPIKE